MNKRDIILSKLLLSIHSSNILASNLHGDEQEQLSKIIDYLNDILLLLSSNVKVVSLTSMPKTEPKEVKEVKIDAIKTNESDCMDVNELFEYIKNNNIHVCAVDNYKMIYFTGEKSCLTEKFKNSIKERKHYIIKRLVMDETISLIMQFPEETQNFYKEHRNDYLKVYKLFSSDGGVKVANFHVFRKLLNRVVTSCVAGSTTGAVLEQFRNTDIFEILLDKSQAELMTDWWGENKEDTVGRFLSNLNFLEKNCILKQSKNKTISENNNIETYKKRHSKNFFAASKIKKHYKYLSKYFIYSKLNNKIEDCDFLKCIYKIGRRIYVDKELFDKWIMSQNYAGKQNDN